MLQKMMILLFLSCVVCLATGQTHTSYTSNKMEPRLKSFVDLALNKANQQYFHGHLNFYAIGEIAQLTPRVRIDVRLRNTECRKVPGANVHTHRPECPFKQLEVRCFVCRLVPTSEPYVDCVRKAHQMTRYADWNEHCVPASTLPTDYITLIRTDDQ